MIRYTVTVKDAITFLDAECPLPLLNNPDKAGTSLLQIGFTSYGAGIRYIRIVNPGQMLLTLSYESPEDLCSNPSLAGLTVGPNAGRLPGNVPLKFAEDLLVTLPANEGINQIHGGVKNLSGRNWILDSHSLSKDGSTLTVSFLTSLPDQLEGWPGNRIFLVTYTLSANGELQIRYEAKSDAPTYINLTNHTYWKREDLTLTVFADHMIQNRKDHLPCDITPLPAEDKGLFDVKKEAVLNNGFLCKCPFSWDLMVNSVKDGNPLRPVAHLHYKHAGLSIRMSTDAPCLIVYTGDYLDDSSLLMDGTTSKPGSFIALEAQELYPFTEYKITTALHPFTRTICYRFLPCR